MTPWPVFGAHEIEQRVATPGFGDQIALTQFSHNPVFVGPRLVNFVDGNDYGHVCQRERG